MKPITVQLSTNQNNITQFVTLLARGLILLNWKQKKPPTHAALLNDVMQHLELEKIKYLLREKEHVLLYMAAFYGLLY